MPRIRCHYEDCIFLDSGLCTADRVELDPELGCMTFQQTDEAVAVAPEWEEAEEEEEETLFDDEDEDEEVEWDEDDDDDEEEEEW